MNILMATADHLMIDRRILQEAKSLVDRGHHVTLLAGFECEKRDSYVVDGIQIERFVYDWGDSRYARFAKRLKIKTGGLLNSISWKIFRSYAARFSDLNSFEYYIFERMQEYQVDVLHVHDLPMLASAVRLKKMRGVPLIYDAHELYYAQVQLPQAIQKKYQKKEASLITAATAVITVNPYIAKIMSARYSIPEPYVIMNAAPLRNVLNQKYFHNKFNLGADVKVVLYQGWISTNRGIEKLVEATKFFQSNVVLVIVGYGDFEVHLKDLVVKSGLSDKVYFYGGVPSNELHPLTCAADLGVIPYHGIDENNHYCSPNKLFEFAIAGLPFICNDLPFLADMINQYGGGQLADLATAQGIASAVNEIFSDEHAFLRMKEGALNARAKLNWDVEEVKLMKIYESILS